MINGHYISERNQAEAQHSRATAKRGPLGNDTSASDSGLFGNVAETGILPFAVTLKEEQQLAGYILWRWGLTGLLPAAHPFRNRPPLIGD